MERESPLFRDSDANPQGALFQRSGAISPTWYLKSEKLIDDKMSGPMAGDDLLRMLRNNGVKADELKWTGIDDLAGGARVTPEAVKEKLAESRALLLEVNKGADSGRGARAHTLEQEAAELSEKLGNSPSFAKYLHATDDTAMARAIAEAPAAERPLLERYAANEREAHALANRGVNKETDRPRYDSYQMPGGNNYREMLLTMPLSQNEIDNFLYPPERDLRDALRDESKSLQIGSADREDIDKRIEAINRSVAKRNPRFNSVHWDEPNVLAHIRFNDRETPEGKKLLHLEEIQSDWHQKGRKRGYREELTEGDKADLAEIREQEEAARRTRDDALRDHTHGRISIDDLVTIETSQTARIDDLNRRADLLLTKIDPSRIPDAPFKKDWQELAFRRMVRYAAENGYDGVSWTPGDKQAERYDLSKQVGMIDYQQNHRLIIYDRRPRIGVTLYNKITSPEELPDVIGKDAAAKLLATEPKNHSGLGSIGEKSRTLYPNDLRFGGEGMKGFYDKIIPDYANKFGKRWDAKVAEASISNERYLEPFDASRCEVSTGCPFDLTARSWFCDESALSEGSNGLPPQECPTYGS